MLFWMVIKSALQSLLANKLRSVLAMMGIIIGVGAVISMLGIGAGAQADIMNRMSAMGTNLLIIRPGNRGTLGVVTGTQQNLTVEDAVAIIDEVPGISMIAPVVNGSAQVKYYGRNARVTITGSSITYMPVRNFEVDQGRCFTEIESENAARVAIIGPTTVENLMGASDPLGQVVKVNGVNFRVVGVTKSKGDQGWFNPDDTLIIPYTTAMKQVFGLDYLREIDIQVADGADANKVIADATRVLRRRHRIADGAPDDFTIRNQAEMLEAANAMSQTFTILLGSIAAISLVVGGIGIMNIMLVTVTERTREIGVRKAIGAKDRDILGQFLTEAVVMSGLGGIIGVAAGFATGAIISKFTSFNTIIQPFSVILALSFSAGVGIFFGFYPAQRASRLDPIEALRYE